MRLIDADALMDKLCEVCSAKNEQGGVCERFLVCAVRRVIKNQPTEEVVQKKGCEVCKGTPDGRRMFGAFSIRNPFHGSQFEIATGHCKPRQIYYCPMCGKKLSELRKGK